MLALLNIWFIFFCLMIIVRCYGFILFLGMSSGKSHYKIGSEQISHISYG